MRTLPRGQRITLRTVTPGLRKIVQLCDNRWQGDRLSVEIVESVHIVLAPSSTQSVFLLDLRAGVSALPEPTILPGERRTALAPRLPHARGVVGAVEPGQAVVEFKFKGYWQAKPNDVTFHMHAFTANAGDQEMLDVARDAFMAGDERRAFEIACDVIPKTHALFTALLKREVAALRTTIKQAEAT